MTRAWATLMSSVSRQPPTDPAIVAGTNIYLNTDQNVATGLSVFGGVGAEYEVKFLPDSNNVLQPYLYSVTSAGAETQLNNGVPLNFGISGNGQSAEVAIPQALLTPSGGSAPAPTSISFAALINNGSLGLPGSFASNPEYAITDPSVVATPSRLETDHARWTVRGLAGSRLCHDAGKYGRRISGLRRSPQRCDSRQHLCDRYRRDRRTDPVDRRRYRHLSEHGSKFGDRLSPVRQPWVPSTRSSSCRIRMACFRPICIR